MASVFENVTAFLRPAARPGADPLAGLAPDQVALVRVVQTMELVPLAEVTRVTGLSPEAGAGAVNGLSERNLLEVVSFTGKDETFLRLTPHGRDVLGGRAPPIAAG